MRVRALLLTLGVSLLAACDTTPVEDSSAQDDRGEIGKADLFGSCATAEGDDLCDGPGSGNCWCDESCVEYGDCCADAGEVCGYEEEPTGCGGWLGDTCGDDEYCAYQPGQVCGLADASSTCEPRPTACPRHIDPVCGCDGNTYSNACNAAASGIGIMHDGQCDPGPTECEPVLCELFCENGFATDEDGCEVCSCAEPEPEEPFCGEVLCALYCEHGFETDENGCEICSCADGPELPEPTECVVSGCNSEICAAEPLFSPCVALPQFACFDTAECGNFGPEGECGWKQTDELTSCLESFE